MRKKFGFIFLLAVVLLSCVLIAAGKRTPTLFMVGDSTMADKTELDISPERGWGQVFPTYLKENVRVENHAMNGRSTKSFVDEGRWDSVLVRMHRGDVLILQFGHNDAKYTDPKRYSSPEQYEANLRRMIRQAQERGVQVVVCTPICRRQFNAQGELEMTHGRYPAAAKRAAAGAGVPLLDMETVTAQWLRELGDQESKKYFMNVKPGECKKFPEGKIDDTHLREAGALAVGAMVVEQLKAQNVRFLTRYLREQPAEQAVYTTFCRPNFK